MGKKSDRSPFPRTALLLRAVSLLLALPIQAAAQVVAYDMVGSTSLNLNSYTNPWNGAFSSSGDGFQKYRRGVSPTIPFAVLDDSLIIFTAADGSPLGRT